ncbi:zinc finger CCCH-type with G patch domain-containing protein [Elgaria multicarinata webbii]|uniref:zinc finger CCCH-type with G patch domain-containing protein n=1 Tax=Elgaria multicarinata webbii TaxID=159646 RepID=UPI002FCD545E
MDEQNLETAIQTYTAQLQQVELALGAGLDPSQQSDLIQLQADLKQLIELTESSLVSVRKSKLCSTVAPGTLSTSPSTDLQQDTLGSGKLSADDEYAAFKEAIAEIGGEDEPSSACNEEGDGEADEEEEELEEEEEEEEAASGMKVKAPYYSSWGTLEYHNAMIVGSECLEDGSPGVRVLYLYPTHKSLKPCPFFLDDKCRFKENCRFSHGQVVSVEELRPFEEPDLSSLAVGSACLARHQDGIWYAAKITDIDSGYYTVKFDSLLLKEAVVEGDGIMPPLRVEESSSSESEGDEVDDAAYAKVIDSGTPENGEGPSTCNSSFGSWEAHTRGIGSKLLAQMGYEFGKGLGKNSEGRVEPVLAVVLPKGKSLDQCAEILQKKREGKLDPAKPRRRRAKGSRAPRLPRQSPKPRNVFDFLNEKLQGKDASEQEGGLAPLERNSKEIYHASKSTKKALSVRLFQTMERIDQTQKDIRGIQEALARNVGRHTVATAQLEEKLAGAHKKLVELRAQEASLQREQKKADTHKKMTEF